MPQNRLSPWAFAYRGERTNRAGRDDVELGEPLPPCSLRLREKEGARPECRRGNREAAFQPASATSTKGPGIFGPGFPRRLRQGRAVGVPASASCIMDELRLPSAELDFLSISSNTRARAAAGARKRGPDASAGGTGRAAWPRRWCRASSRNSARGKDSWCATRAEAPGVQRGSCGPLGSVRRTARTWHDYFEQRRSGSNAGRKNREPPAWIGISPACLATDRRQRIDDMAADFRECLTSARRGPVRMYGTTQGLPPDEDANHAVAAAFHVGSFPLAIASTSAGRLSGEPPRLRARRRGGSVPAVFHRQTGYSSAAKEAALIPASG